MKWLLLFAPCLVAGCDRGDGGLPWARQPNVLLVVVDTLRKDHLQPYGYAARATSPQLQELAREAVTVDGLACVSSWTMPSMATLFTGLTPAQHGVMRMLGEHSRLRADRTLAQVFRDNGYATACVMSNFLLARRRGVGFQQGFDVYDDELALLPDPHQGSTAQLVADKGIAWLSGQDGSQPYFLVLHFFDPHASFQDHPQYDFADPQYSGWVQGGLDNDVYREHETATTEADRRQLAAYYDEEIRAVDAALGRVLAHLRQRPDWEDTLVVFTADHGEELGERGHIGHTQTLHAELVDLPLIVRLPGGFNGGTLRSGAGSQVALYAAILALAQVAEPPARPELVRLLMQDAAAGPGPLPVAVFSEVDFTPGRSEHAEKFTRKRAVLRTPHKLVHDLKTREVFLYDLAQDPGETRNLAGDPAWSAVQAGLQKLMDEHTWWEEQP